MKTILLNCKITQVQKSLSSEQSNKDNTYSDACIQVHGKSHRQRLILLHETYLINNEAICAVEHIEEWSPD